MGLTGITSDKILQAPPLEQVLAEFRDFVADSPLIGYNAIKSDLPILAENGLEFTDQYAVDVFEEASKRRPSDLHGIKNLQLHTVAQFLGVAGKSHDSLEDARMTALVYEAFLESDRAATPNRTRILFYLSFWWIGPLQFFLTTKKTSII